MSSLVNQSLSSKWWQ